MLAWPRLRFPKAFEHFGGMEVVLHSLEARLQGLDARAAPEISVDIPAPPPLDAFRGKGPIAGIHLRVSRKLDANGRRHAVCSSLARTSRRARIARSRNKGGTP